YVAERARRAQQDEAPPLTRRMMGGLLKLVAVFLVLALVAGTVWWQRNNLVAGVTKLAGMMRSAPTQQQPQRDTATPPGRAKIADRIGQPDGAQQQQEAPVAQRVVLYEEDPADSAGKRFVG